MDQAPIAGQNTISHGPLVIHPSILAHPISLFGTGQGMAIGQLPPLSKLLCCAVLAGDVVKSSTTSSRARHLP